MYSYTMSYYYRTNNNGPHVETKRGHIDLFKVRRDYCYLTCLLSVQRSEMSVWMKMKVRR